MMKQIILFSAIALSFCAFPHKIYAQTESAVQTEDTERRMSAFSLVSAAYRGRFEEWGIPSYATLQQAYRGGDITATKLVEAAIKAEELSPIALEDEGYLSAVEGELNDLKR